MKTFFGDHSILAEKRSEFASIQLKPNENSGQVRLRLNQTSKKAPQKRLLNKCGFFPDHITVIRVLLFLISKKIFAIFARIHSEQGGFLKISFVSYITDTLTYSV